MDNANRQQCEIIGKLNALAGVAQDSPDGSTYLNSAARKIIEEASKTFTRVTIDAACIAPKMRLALELARVALNHDAPGSCWATGPLTGNPIEDLIVCPGCRALRAIDEVISANDALPASAATAQPQPPLSPSPLGPVLETIDEYRKNYLEWV